MSSSQFAYYNSGSNPLNTLFQNTGTGITKGVFAVQPVNPDSTYATAGTGEVFRAENESFQYSDNLDWVHGRHSVSAGFNYFRKSEIDWDIQRNVTFGGFSSSGGDLGYVGGDNMADLVMGLPQNLLVRYNINGGSPTAPDYNIIFPYWGFYVNDKFRINPKWTVSVGLRYDLEHSELYAESRPLLPAARSILATPDGGILKYPGIAAGVPIHYLSASKKDFRPTDQHYL